MVTVTMEWPVDITVCLPWLPKSPITRCIIQGESSHQVMHVEKIEYKNNNK